MNLLDYFTKEAVSTDVSLAFKTFADILLKFLHSGIIVAICLILNGILKRIIKRSFAKTGNKYPVKNYETLSTLTVSIVKYAIYFFMLFQILTIFGVSVESLLAMAGVGGIAIGFGAKSIVEDCITGATILMEEQFRVGDTVIIDNKTGTVEAIGFRTTSIRSFDGDMHIFPNSMIKSITNMSKVYNRAVVEVPVPYNQSIEKIIMILNDEVEYSHHVLEGVTSPPIVLGITDMKPTHLIIRIIADCKIGENWNVERELRKMIKIRFEKEGIKPPCTYEFHDNI